MGFFDKGVVVDTEKKALRERVESLQNDIVRQREDSDRYIRQMREDFDSENRIRENEEKIRIQSIVLKKEEENIKLRGENAVLVERTRILEKAFENLGFDVKDMKAILDKLVDGIVSGNTVNVIK